MNRIWLEPWNELTGPQKEALKAELHQLLPRHHPLFGVKVETIGRRFGTREVLFKSTGSQWLVIDFTRFGSRDNEYPRFELYRSWSAFATQKMRADHANGLPT